MRKCCKNCKHFVNTRTTERGYKPYFGDCDAGHPIYKGQTFTRKGIAAPVLITRKMRQGIKKATGMVGLLALNEDGELIHIFDEAWCFQFVKGE